MEQRTCNLIRCCKGSCELPGAQDQEPLEGIKAYMGRECGCEPDTYTPRLVETILKTALYDYLSTADNPSFEVRQLLDQVWTGKEPTLSQRIMTMFSLTQVREDGAYVNGFTEELMAQSDIDLGITFGRWTGSTPCDWERAKTEHDKQEALVTGTAP